jgi:arginyl-tRNA synthetase
MIYTVGNEQDYHFKVLFLILQKLGYSWAQECYHLSYGMVELPEGKMKSREGTVVDADELMETMVHAAREEGEKHGTFEQLNDTEKTELSEMIGMAALKYFLLRVDPKKKMLFNPKESIDLTGNTGPFIQYTHARLKAILRRAEAVTSDFESVDLNEKERNLSKILVQFPQAIEDAGNTYSPAILINYTYELVKAYNSFYQSVSIFNADNNAQRDLRILLSAITAKVVKQSMGILGINVPDRM